MSGEPKTLTLTLEETAVRVAEESDYLLARGEDGWGLIKRTVLGWDSEGLVWDDWEDAASFALGVPVVARDEAAELRAENEELRRIAKHALSALGTWVSFGQREAAREEIERDLRRLAGGESEK